MEGLLDPRVVAVVAPIFAGLMSIAIVIALIRIIKGPAIMDRVMGTDILLAVVMGSVGSYVALSARFDLLPVVLVAAMFAFVGTVAVSRYVSRNSAALDYQLPVEDSAEPSSEPADTTSETGADNAADAQPSAGVTPQPSSSRDNADGEGSDT